MKDDFRLIKRHGVRLSDYWLAVQILVLVCQLPVLLRLYPLPSLLQRLTLRDPREKIATDVELERAVRLVLRVCQLRPFRTRVFPRPCLRQALALYYTLTYLGYAVTIYFGILRNGKELRGHSWVTVKGRPVAEKGDPAVFHIVYSHLSNQPNAVPDVREVFSPKEQFL